MIVSVHITADSTIITDLWNKILDIHYYQNMHKCNTDNHVNQVCEDIFYILLIQTLTPIGHFKDYTLCSSIMF
jgi:hypothetical protein